MIFTKYNSLADILRYPDMEEYLRIFYSEYLLAMYPEDRKDLPVARIEQIAKTPWGEPFSIIADQLMDCVNLVMDLRENGNIRAISLWRPGEEWTPEKGRNGGKDSVFLIAPAREAAEKVWEKRRPAVIICPGGGYEAVCFSGEGTPVMRYMEAKGYCAFMLRYRVSPVHYPQPQEDLALAVQYVRSHAEEYHLDPDNIMLIGASAGGHLCASYAALWEEAAALADEELKETDQITAENLASVSAQPNKLVLSYPVISLDKEQHEGSAYAIAGNDWKLRKRLSAENLVTSSYPKTFVWACADDDCVPPSNAVRMGEALKNVGVDYELHIYPSGGHGCGLAYSKQAYDWSRAMTEFMK